jgi:hypothetical protein
VAVSNDTQAGTSPEVHNLLPSHGLADAMFMTRSAKGAGELSGSSTALSITPFPGFREGFGSVTPAPGGGQFVSSEELAVLATNRSTW